MKKFNNLFLVLISISVSIAFAGSFFAYSTSGKSPGLMDFGGTARTLGTGYGLYASPDAYVLNTANFASWANRSNTQFSFSFNSSIYKIEGNNLLHNWTDFAFDNVAINIPISKNNWTLGLGFAPVTTSKVGFKVEDEIGTIYQRFNGSFVDGYLNNSFRVFDNLYASAGFVFTFGNLTDEFKLNARDDLYLNDISSTISYQGRLPSVEFGFHYDDSTLQVSGQAIVPIKGDISTVQSSPGSTTPEIIRDFKMPLRISGGMAYTFNRFKVGISGKYENWQKGFEIGGQNFSKDLTDAILIGSGFETIPVRRIFASGWEKISWRFGFHGAILNNKDHFSVIKEYGIHAGIGIPFNAYFSNIDIGLEIGQRGDIDINLAKETYFKIGFSFTAGERWFISLDEY